MSIILNGTTGITTPDLTSTDDITANSATVLTSASNIPAANLTGSLPAIDGSALTGVGGVASLNGETGAITNTDLASIGNTVTGLKSGYYNVGSNFSLGTTYTSISAYTLQGDGARAINVTAVAGTWRCIGGMGGAYIQGGPQSNMIQGLFVRVS
jgi:hypothetical protein